MINILEDYVCADRFMDIADVVCETGYLDRDANWNPLPRTYFRREEGYEKIAKQNCIIFCKKDYVSTIFDLVRQSKYKHVLITMNCDFNVEGHEFDNRPPNIVYWFAQNVNAHREGLIPLPIGIERVNGGGSSYDYKAIALEYNIPRDISNLVYMNHTDRNHPFRSVIKSKLKTYDWVTCVEDKVTFPEYLKQTHSHRYIVSPIGNSLDGHRTWEAMYLGVIPIVNSNFVNNHFKHLPMLIVDDISTVTEYQLLTQLEYFDANNVTVRDYAELTFGYWKNYIYECMESLK